MPIPLMQLLIGIAIGIGYFVLRPRSIKTVYADEGHSRRRRAASPNSRPSYLSKPEDDCLICLEVLNEKPMTYLSCGHALHDNCLQTLRTTSNLCPHCHAYI